MYKGYLVIHRNPVGKPYSPTVNLLSMHFAMKKADPFDVIGAECQQREREDGRAAF